MLAAEGAVLFLERVSPAIEQVDSSSGAIGTAVNHAIDDLCALIVDAPADATTRERWLERLWDACQQDEIPYLETIGTHWGSLCGTPGIASTWADSLLPVLRQAWNPNPAPRGYFKGTSHCLSALLAAGRCEELLRLLETAPHPFWHDRLCGAKALAAMGRPDDAIRYAEEGRGVNAYPVAIARTCERILLAAGRHEEAYQRFGLLANQAGTHLAWFRAVARKYPDRHPTVIVSDLVRLTPGDEGKWFAAAKEARLYDEALALARRSPCDPRTLARAAADFAERKPDFAVEAGVLSVSWLASGYGYEISTADVWKAFQNTLHAAERNGNVEATLARVRQLAANDRSIGQVVTAALGRALWPAGRA